VPHCVDVPSTRGWIQFPKGTEELSRTASASFNFSGESMTTTATLKVPGYLAGTWTIDPIHSHVGS
jgi:expansin (peptidoglycan-binding protein)